MTSGKMSFKLGAPVLVCRWRIAKQSLPLEGRHLRAFGQRRVGDGAISPLIVAWAKQHIEWTLHEGAAAHPDGVLMLVVDEGGQCVMSVGPYEPLHKRSVAAIVARAVSARMEAKMTTVAPESLWAFREGGLVVAQEDSERLSGVASLVADLAMTRHIPVVRDQRLIEEVQAGDAWKGDAQEKHAAKDLFLASDEHGIVPAIGHVGDIASQLMVDYARLCRQDRQELV